MNYYLNKIVWFFLNPQTAFLVGAVAGAILLGCAGTRTGRRLGGWMLGLSLALLWFASTMGCVFLLGLPLERPYLAAQKAEALPEADAIVLLGGGIGKADGLDYPDLFEGSDRVWHAARLWKAGKAPVIIASGTNELEATVPLLLDLGVPRSAIVVDNESRNTYENSRFTERLLGGGPKGILLVTSAWHMPRACGNFARTSLGVVPAATDFTVHYAWFCERHPWDWVAPDAGNLARTSFLLKEWLGRLARK